MRRIYFIVSLLVVAVVAMAAVYECDTQKTTGCLYIPGSGADLECRGPGGGGGGGGAPPPTAVPTASPTAIPTASPTPLASFGGFTPYTFDSDRNCPDSSDWIDPINVVTCPPKTSPV